MANNPRLKKLLSPLLRQMRIDETQLEDAFSYAFEAGETLTVQLEENPDSFLTVSCLLPMTAEDFASPQRLALLLQCNVLGLEHPPVLTGTLIEQQKLILWTRLAFSDLEAPQLIRLFERFLEQATLMEQWLQQPMPEPEAV